MRTSSLRRFAVPLLCLPIVGACDSTTEPEEQRLVNVLLDFCANDTPVWFAFRNQDADWVRVNPDAEGTFALTATNRVILAFTRLDGASPHTEIVYAHNMELETISGRACLEETGSIQVNGSVTGVGAGELAQVSANFETVFVDPEVQTAFELSQLPARPVDIVASRVSVDGPSHASNRVIIRRSFPPTNNATLQPLDFSVVSTEVFTPTTATLSITGATGAGGYVLSNFFSQLETSHELTYLDGLPPSSVSVTAIPTAQLAEGDYHSVFAVVFDASGNARGAQRYFRAPAVLPMPIAGEAPSPAISAIASAPYLRLRASAQRPTAYGGAFNIEYMQTQSISERRVTVTMTRLYHSGGGTWTVDVPDLSSVAGWQNGWGLQSGGSAIDWTAIVIGGRGELALGAPPEDGEGLPFATFSSSAAAAEAYRVTRSPSALRPRLFGRAR